VALAGLILGAMTGPASAQAPQTSLPDLEDEVMCLTCGTTLALSESPQAQRERDYINVLIAEGLSKDEVKDELVAQYGPNVLATPGTEGFDLAAWLLPIVAMLGVGAALIVGVRRWKAEGSETPGASEPQELGPGEPAGDARLRSDLERYEL